MGQNVTNQARFCQIPSFMKKEFSTSNDRREIILAVSLITVLAISSLLSNVLWPPVIESGREDIPPSFIAIDGDANFSATALLEGWPGDGSPENPYIIDGLDIDLTSRENDCSCIGIHNTRVSFIISNCSITGAGARDFIFRAGIFLENVTNGELVNNTCYGNLYGIYFSCSHSNTVASNICNDNIFGICLSGSHSNTVVNNTCNYNNNVGLRLFYSDLNTVVNNTCNNIAHEGGWSGIDLWSSDFNILINNTCVNDVHEFYVHDIYLRDSYSNTVVDNIAHIDMEFEPEATESEEYVASEFYPVYPLLIVLLGITLLGGVWISRHPMRVPSEILSTEHTGSSVLCHLNKGWEDN